MNACVAFMAYFLKSNTIPRDAPKNRSPMIALHIAVTVCRIFSGTPAQNEFQARLPLRRPPLSPCPEPDFPDGRVTVDLPRLYHCSGVFAGSI